MADDKETMNWVRLMSSQRYRGAKCSEDITPMRENRDPFIRDYDRIVFSSAFRRLQDKTQVFPFPESDYVRTRLTHSLEVCSVGRSLGTAIGRHVIEDVSRTGEATFPTTARESVFGSVVAAACLAHDIGHPPFGHAGEEAIKHWFTYDRPEILTDRCTSQQRADFVNFDANAQGFRIITRLQYWREHGGMQLCFATLGTFSKYPRSSPVAKNGKFGYFQSDREAFECIAEKNGLIPERGSEGAWARHPLAFLVEAADDICYLTIDLEDGFKSQRITFEEVEEILAAIGVEDKYKNLADLGDRICYLRSKAISALIEQTVQVFVEREREILTGTFNETLLAVIKKAPLVEQVRNICRERLYNDERKVKAEIAGFSIVRTFLSVYTDVLLEWENRGYDINALPEFHRKIVSLMPAQNDLPHTRYEWLLRVTDFVSAMSDSYAVEQYKILTGQTPLWGLASTRG